MSKVYNRQAALTLAEQLVRSRMAAYDSSHDALHVWRVRRLALEIAKCETAAQGKTIDADVVEFAALFHDLQDHKYNSGGPDGRGQTTDQEMRDIMLNNGFPAPKADLVLRIVSNMSYSTEMKLRKGGLWGDWHQGCLELHCVQDADRLDAIGTFGIFRAAAYATAVNRPLYAYEDDAINSARTVTDFPASLAGDVGERPKHDPFSSYQHYYDKLFLLKDTMKTETGKVVGVRRHQIMVQALAAMNAEFNLSDFP